MTDREVLVRLRANVSDYNRAMISASTATKAFVKDLDSSNDRMSNIIQTSLALGPALVPIGAAVVPAISGMTAALGFAAVGAGATALAFSGVGDALKALNDYQLDPTEAHLKKMTQTMEALGPAGRDFAVFLQELRPELQKLQDTAQEGMLPGVQEGIETLLTRMPEVQQILERVSGTLGSLASRSGAALAGPEFTAFFTYLETEAGPALNDMGVAVGNVITGLANMVMAFDPLNDDFFSGLVSATEAFANWSANLDSSTGFQHFLSYVQEVGPKAWETLGNISLALIEIVEAAAPVGQIVLSGLDTFAKVLAVIADSPVGPVLLGAAAGLSAVSRAVAVYNVVNGSAMTKLLGNMSTFKLGGTVVPSVGQFGTVLGRAGQSAQYASEQTLAARTSVRNFASAVAPAAIAIGALGLAATGVADKVGLANTATLAAAGSLVGPWGIAVGAAVGLGKDLADVNDDLAAAVKRAEAAMSSDVSLQDKEAALEALRLKAKETEDAIYDALHSGGSHDIGTQFGQGMIALGDAFTGAAGKAERAADDLAFDIDTAKNSSGDLGLLLGTNLAPSLGVTAQSFQDAMTSADDFKESLDGINAILDKRAAFRAYQAAVDDAAERLQKRAEIQQKINELEAEGARDRANIRRDAGQGSADTGGDLAQLQRKLAEARHDASGASTSSARENAAQRVLDIEKQIRDLQTGRGRDAQDTNDKLSESYRRQAEQIAALKKQLKDLAPTDKPGSKGGRENQEKLDNIAKTALQFATNLEGVARVNFLDKARDNFLAAAEDLKVPTRQAERLADRLGLLDKDVDIPTPKLDTGPVVEKVKDLEDRLRKLEKNRHFDLLMGDTQALEALENLREKIARLKHIANVQVHVDTRLGPIGSAAGNLLTGGDYANGHLPAIYPGGTVPRMFAEAETKGESYIPHANDWRRPRALDIWEQTGRILGVQFQHFATGAVVAGARSAYAPAPSYAGAAGLSGGDVDRIARALAAGRSLYGDVHVADGTDFLRVLEEDHRRASLEGGR